MMSAQESVFSAMQTFGTRTLPGLFTIPCLCTSIASLYKHTRAELLSDD